MILPVQLTGDIFTMPMSYMYNRAGQVFYFIIHIPLVQPEQVMNMFKYIPFPMMLSTSKIMSPCPDPDSTTF